MTLKIKQPQPFANSYCGRGNLHRCQKSLWTAIAAAGRVLAKQQGTATPNAWRPAQPHWTSSFAPLNPLTMSYTNRPSGIQQVISFDRHR
jgi:hypothetical protein